MTATATIPLQPRDTKDVCAQRAGVEFLRLVPRDFAREHLILSQGRRDGVERFAVAPSSDPAAIFNVGVHLGVHLDTHLADGEAIAQAIDEAYGAASPEGSEVDSAIAASLGNVDELLAAADRDLLSTQGKGPIVKLVDALLFEALSRGASDVHVQPLADRTLVRYRLDGVLHTVREFKNARQLTAAIVSRIKVMGRMDIAERRLPQDGRAAVNIGSPAPGSFPPGNFASGNFSDSGCRASADKTSGGGGRAIDLRISTLPTSYGERAVIRLLDNTNHLCDFEKIGMPSEVAERYLERARRANGMILLTGPTGSGKTTTLYSTLRQVAAHSGGGTNIMTIEDPIEYELATVGLAISQAQVNPRKGVTFATGLRHILRQDPDVVMVGEVRDAETARIAIQSSLTGHLVFSTLHTNDAPSAVTRLIDLGVEPYLVGASLSAVLAQRLVRTLHAECGGAGCEGCFGTGFLGRTGIFELMTIDETIAELISDNAPVSKIREAARTSGGGLRTLAEDGERLVRMGKTTLEEVKRVVQGAGG